MPAGQISTAQRNKGSLQAPTRQPRPSKSRLTDQHEMVSPSIMPFIGDSLPDCNFLGRGMVCDADVCRILCQVVEGGRSIGGKPACSKGYLEVGRPPSLGQRRVRLSDASSLSRLADALPAEEEKARGPLTDSLVDE